MYIPEELITDHCQDICLAASIAVINTITKSNGKQRVYSSLHFTVHYGEESGHKFHEAT